MSTNKKKTKRYNLALPESLYNELGQAADERGVTIVELLRYFIKLGLLLIKLMEKENISFLVREGDKEREIIILGP